MPEYKISTITVTGAISSPVSIFDLFDKAQPNASIKYLQIMCMDQLIMKGDRRLAKKRKKKPKAFQNQTTIVMQPFPDLPGYKVNMKVFKTGAIQITGVKDVDDGVKCIQVIIDEIRKLHAKGHVIASNPDAMEVRNYTVRLINSDFHVGFKINNMALYRVMEETDVATSYDPIVYPGVKVMYFYNDAHERNFGVCQCTLKCTGKGCGSGDGMCKKVTIIIFQSGSVIITGGTAVRMVDRAYGFIKGLLLESRQRIEMRDPRALIDEVEKARPRKGILEWLGINSCGGGGEECDAGKKV